MRRAETQFGTVGGPWAALSGVTAAGYEIHHGVTVPGATSGVREVAPGLAWQNADGNVLGAYLHGLFEDAGVLAALLGQQAPTFDTVFDGLADFLQQHVNAELLHALIA